MVQPNEPPKPETKSEHIEKIRVDAAGDKNRSREAVLDAQFMMDYAATNTAKIIDPLTLHRLIVARKSIEKGEELTPEMETEFWLAYQDLWEIVSPATAESIRANLVIEETFVSRLVDFVPGLSRWLGKGRTSRARKTVNGYIFFTILVLLLLVAIQIYWVVGDQLIREMSTISQREEFLTSQIAGISSTSASTTDPNSTKAALETDLKAINAKEERYAAILWLWSKPWNGFIEVVHKEHDPKFAPRFADLENQIAEIEKKQREDPEGSNEARVNAQQEDLKTKLAEARAKDKPDEKEIKDLEAQIANISRITELEADLLKLTANIQSDQSKRDTLDTQKQDNKNLIISLSADKNTIQENIKSINQEMGLLPQTIAELANTNKNIQALLVQYEAATPAADAQPLSISLEDMSILPDDLKAELQGKTDLSEQIASLVAYQTDIQLQLEYLNAKQKDYENQLAQLSLNENDLQVQISELETQISEWETEIAALDASLETAQANMETANQDIQVLKDSIKEFQGEITAEEQKAIVDKRVADLLTLKAEMYSLSLEEQEYLDRTDSRPAQLAGQFVLNILQSYFLPILYGLLGASTSVLRSLSRQIKEVTFSEKTGIQHLLSISLGALAGIVVGWFSFLIDSGTKSFLGSVSPLAIAFLVGFNIDPFFSRMDLIMKSGSEAPRAIAPTAPKLDDRPPAPPASLAPAQPSSTPASPPAATNKDLPREV
ncbi:MAG TPA: hypothetical protein PK989_07540 [Anaerolineales bacterium]|nr:hypothetical protein [Anaerolineales bacterium]